MTAEKHTTGSPPSRGSRALFSVLVFVVVFFQVEAWNNIGTHQQLNFIKVTLALHFSNKTMHIYALKKLYVTTLKKERGHEFY